MMGPLNDDWLQLIDLFLSNSHLLSAQGTPASQESPVLIFTTTLQFAPVSLSYS